MICKSIKAVLPLVGDGSAPGPAHLTVRYGLAGQRLRCWKARSIRSQLSKDWGRRPEARGSGPALGVTKGMPTFQFTQVNVFSADPLGGNPLAVVHAAGGLSEAQMAALARWTNLSETTFLLPPTDPGADYYVRIFTPGGELPFAGHPTLGSCHAWLAAGGKPRKPVLVVQQCGVGLVRVRCDGPRLEFAAPPLHRTGALEPDVLAKIAKALALLPSTRPSRCGRLLAPVDTKTRSPAASTRASRSGSSVQDSPGLPMSRPRVLRSSAPAASICARTAKKSGLAATSWTLFAGRSISR